MRLVLQEPAPNRGDSEGREGPPRVTARRAGAEALSMVIN